MIDYYHLADNQYKDWVYTGPIGTSTSSSIFYWVKPRGITMVHITAIGAGGGGGSGNSSVNTAASGGSGGGSGAVTRLTIPAISSPMTPIIRKLPRDVKSFLVVYLFA